MAPGSPYFYFILKKAIDGNFLQGPRFRSTEAESPCFYVLLTPIPEPARNTLTCYHIWFTGPFSAFALDGIWNRLRFFCVSGNVNIGAGGYWGEVSLIKIHLEDRGWEFREQLF